MLQSICSPEEGARGKESIDLRGAHESACRRPSADFAAIFVTFKAYLVDPTVIDRVQRFPDANTASRAIVTVPATY